MTSSPKSDGEIGLALADRLGLTFKKREGHDLAGPCIACKSSDAFRLHSQSGVAQCYSCGGKWSPFQVAESVLKNRDLAKSLLVQIGIVQPSKNGHDQKAAADPLTLIAHKKSVTVSALKAFGAKVVSSTSIQLPAYGPDGKSCTTFTLTTKGSKGLFAKGKPAGLFFPHLDGKVRIPQPGETWHLVEGPKDAAALHDLGLLACGLNTCRLAAKFAPLFQGVDVVLVPDRDRGGEEGSQHSCRVLRGIASTARIAVLPAEFKDSRGSDVRDVLKREGGRDFVLKAIQDARPWEPAPTGESSGNDRPEIEVTPDEHLVNDQAIAALVRDDSIFQRGGVIVQILYDHGKKTLKGITRPAHTPRICPLREASLRERLSRVARFVKYVEKEEGVEVVQQHPPAFCTSAVAARGHWPSVRHLEGVINSPILRSDGTVLQTPGYDPVTGLYYEPDGPIIDVPESPTFADARASCDALLEVVVDFPFATPAHRSAWLAFLLTPLARHAFAGPSPLFMIDANVRASGKSLLADSASLIVTGRDIARMTSPEDDDETRKRITAIAINGDQMILIDNIAGELGSASLDAALTGTVWKDRILGRSEIVEMPLLTTWAATGNNVILKADTSRRVCHIRLESLLENPEERQDFKQPNLKQWLLANRSRLLARALTILAAYCRAGRPDQRLKAWGSFEGWSDVVRQAVVWAGLPDPGETRQELARSADREAAALRSLILGWAEIDPEGTGLTAAKMIERLETSPKLFEVFRNAVSELCPAPAGKLPGPRSLGNKLRHLRGRVVGGKAINRRDCHGTAVWFVEEPASNRLEPAAQGGSGGFGCSVSAESPRRLKTSSGDADISGHSRRPDSEQPEPPEPWEQRDF
jgi:hypothetical protein